MRPKTALMVLLTLPLFYGVIDAQELMINTQDGDLVVLDVDPSESLEALETHVTALLGGKKTKLWITIPADDVKIGKTFQLASSHGDPLGYPRVYDLEVNPQEKADIRFIITTLANKSLLSIALIKGELESAGERISHVHPLRFLMTIFQDEELKVGIRNIRSKGWAWNHFVGGLKHSLAAEMHRNNMKDEYLLSFAQMLKIEMNLILPAIVEQRWDEFIDLLITHIPRQGDHNRYDT